MNDMVGELAEVLEAENAALAAVDFAAAAALLARKQAIAQAFAEAAASGAVRFGRDVTSGQRLREAAARNRALLERGIEVQRRVIAIVAKAAATAAGETRPRYSAGGCVTPAAGPVALSVRA